MVYLKHVDSSLLCHFLVERCFFKTMGRSVERLVKLLMMTQSFKWPSRLRTHVKTREQSRGIQQLLDVMALVPCVWLSPLAGECVECYFLYIKKHECL